MAVSSVCNHSQCHSDLQDTGESESSTNAENSSQTGTGTQSSTNTAKSKTSTNNSAGASVDGMDDEGKSNSSNNKNNLVPCRTVGLSLDADNIVDTSITPTIAAIALASTHMPAGASMLVGMGSTIVDPIVAPATDSLAMSGKVEETHSASGAAASQTPLASHPVKGSAFSSASTLGLSVQGQISTATIVASGPCTGQGIPLYFNRIFLNSFNNILDVCMDSPPIPSKVELQGGSRTTGGIF